MNAPILFGLIGMWETVAILAVVLVLFGAKKVPELARGLGQGIKEFKKASREVNDEMQRAFEEEPLPAKPVAPPKPTEEIASQSVPRSTPEQKG
jgi:sec-independent protein translocase protein TatA